MPMPRSSTRRISSRTSISCSGFTEPTGNETIAMIARELRDPVVHLAREAHHVGRDVVDAAGALDAVLASRKRSTFSGDASTSFAFACEASSIIASTSGLTICHGWMWTWTSKTSEVLEIRLSQAGSTILDLSELNPSQHHQPHADRAAGQASWNSREARSCGCTSSRSMVLKPRLRKYSSAVVVRR